MRQRLATFWRSYLYALRRAAVDARSRLFALKVTFFAVYVVASVVVFGVVIPLKSEEGPAQYYAFQGFIFLTGFLAFLALRRRNAKADEVLRFSLTRGGRLLAVPSAAEQGGDAGTILWSGRPSSGH